MTIDVPSEKIVRPAIEVDHLSTSYRVHVKGSSVLGGFTDLFKRGQSTDRVVPAVRDVSFDVQQGTVLGVKDLTGRENIRLGGLAMGIDKERVDEIVDAIADFAQLGEYVDFPVETYSSGMRARLGFAVTAHLDPEVLLIDEALAGGDSKFQAETAHKMAEMCGNGRTIVLVSHSLTAIKTMASQCIWMHQGRIVEQGDPEDVTASYMRYCRLSDADLLDDD
jgi:ABC-type polysaccharide/polyol phosphate transport system ATPase subunit